MKELIGLYFQLAWLRRGPQDIPASSILLAVTIAIYFIVNAGCGGWLLPQEGPWTLKTAADVALTFVWYFVMLRIAHKPDRFLQTATAVFGYQIVLSPPSLLAVWLLRLAGEDSLWQLPLLTGYLMLLFWFIRVNVGIVKAALEWKTAAATALVILQLLVSYGLFAYFSGPPR